MSEKITEILDKDQIEIIGRLKDHASNLIDHTYRFKYFTLHGKQHIENMFKILDLFLRNGLVLDQEPTFILACCICLHDVGMVVPLVDQNVEKILGGFPQSSDPANIELKIRQNHHKLIDVYTCGHSDFLLGLGITPGQSAMISEISKMHRINDLNSKSGYIKTVGALLRVIDEIDIGPKRAPTTVLMEHFKEMDSTSLWHWYKHNICDDWNEGHNFIVDNNKATTIYLNISVHPQIEKSIPYWLRQIERPIQKVLTDENSARIIKNEWGLDIVVRKSFALSSVNKLGGKWSEIENRALSSGRKVILVADDEARKMEDLFLPLMEKYHVIFAVNTKDALDKINAATVDLVIADLQIGSGFTLTLEETSDFKMTGLNLCHEIINNHPNVKVGILTGSRHNLTKINEIKEYLEREIET